MPEQFRAQADAAIEVHRQRGWTPDVVQGTSWWGSPYAEEDGERWAALMFEIFGTRQTAVVNAFMAQLSEFGPQVYKNRHKGQGEWQLSEDGLRQMLSIMLALKPQDEAQAALAAQMVALHLSSMRLAETSARYRGGDSRTLAVLNKTVNAYGAGMERMQRLQGRAQQREVVQRIEVVYVDQRDQRSITFAGGGVPYGGQPHATDGSATVERPALPSPKSGGKALRIASGEGKAGVQDARWVGWLGRTYRRAQRLLSARGLDR